MALERHQVETMAYRKASEADVPWHGIGFPIDHNATPEEMLVASGLNWTVSKRPLIAPPTPTTEIGRELGVWPSTVYEGAEYLEATDIFALVRDSDNRVLGPAGKAYIPTQNDQAFHFFKKFVDAGHMSMDTAGSLQGGKQVWVLAKINASFELAGGDRVEGFLLLSSPHIWGKSLVIKFVPIRVVCRNTFAMAMNDASWKGKAFRMPHIRAFDGEAELDATKTLDIAVTMFDQFKETATLLSEAKVNPELYVKYVADLFQPELIVDAFGKNFYKMSAGEQARTLIDSSVTVAPNQLNRVAFNVHNLISGQPGASLESSRGTLWGAFNAVTYYTDHTIGRDRDKALYSAWFGTSATIKTRALAKAVRLADALALAR